MNNDVGDNPLRPVDLLFGPHRRDAIEMSCCAHCGGEAELFADELSKREYRISGLCQNCQNNVFGYLEEEGDYADTGQR